MVRLTEVIAPHFYGVHRAIMRREYETYRLKGGRGSCKSSFIAGEVVQLIMKFPMIDAIVFMKHQNRLRNGAYALYMTAVERLGVAHLFEFKLSPMHCTYLPTGQTIWFYGLDSADKTKGYSPSSKDRYFGITHFEELDQFEGYSEVRTARASCQRGGDIGWNFECYNPPRNAAHWVNKLSEQDKGSKLVLIHHSDYRSVPKEWLGKIFLAAVEALKETDYDEYSWMYLGIVTGLKGRVFAKFREESMTDEQIEFLKNDGFYPGFDWGWIAPSVFVAVHYDEDTRTVTFLYEKVWTQTSVEDIASDILGSGYGNCIVQIDGAIPENTGRFLATGLMVETASKYNRDASFQWLENKNIRADPERCPYVCGEFEEYEREFDEVTQEYIDEYPKGKDHGIDATRYALIPYISAYGDPLMD